MLRCAQLGLRLSDLHLIDVGMVIDMLIESGNDGESYRQVASQEDFDNF